MFKKELVTFQEDRQNEKQPLKKLTKNLGKGRLEKIKKSST